MGNRIEAEYELYEAAGSNYAAAWRQFKSKDKIPPSWEVFSHGYGIHARKRRNYSPMRYASEYLMGDLPDDR